ncbi:type II toxin-antitoxin system MqsA family antitoxin [Legionella sp. CNM-4043-24]|uniref:type II toxin-antitoxin system MqsA family antitoxin n=1 Tax=Legionella sp. CNM-4043-24 TaxID=3421646 RepID=UPI00403AB5E9
MTKKKCMVCGENTCEYKTKKIPFTYKGETTFINQPGEWCDTCGEGVLTDKDTHITMKEMQTHKAKVDHLLTPDDIRRIRKKLHINQKEAAEYFGGGVNGFSRYERGECPPPKSLSSLFVLLDKDPRQIEELINCFEQRV